MLHRSFVTSLLVLTTLLCPMAAACTEPALIIRDDFPDLPNHNEHRTDVRSLCWLNDLPAFESGVILTNRFFWIFAHFFLSDDHSEARCPASPNPRYAFESRFAS